MGSRIIFQEGMDVYQTLPTSGARAPGFAIGDTDYGNRPIGKSSFYPRKLVQRSPKSRRELVQARCLGVAEKLGPLKVVLGSHPCLVC